MISIRKSGYTYRGIDYTWNNFLISFDIIMYIKFLTINRTSLFFVVSTHNTFDFLGKSPIDTILGIRIQSFHKMHPSLSCLHRDNTQ